jgi:2-haloacid dehalogenase
MRTAGIMNPTFAFDVYGTLIDPLGIATMLQSSVGDAAPAFAQAWRDKQLEYLFRRALMHEYRDFPTCTREALDFTNARFGMRLSARDCETLLAKYRELPAFPDAVDGLASLKAGGHRLFAFSNGHPRELVPLLEQAGLNWYLDGIVSVHPVASFKPDPAVYRHFIDSTGSDARVTWLVSGNSFDVLGAAAVGWRTAWIKRDVGAIFDPWDVEPTVTAGDLRALAVAVQQAVG